MTENPYQPNAPLGDDGVVMLVLPRIQPDARWPYEQAYVENIVLEFKRELAFWNDLERYLAKCFGRALDNKVVYRFTTPTGPLFIGFKDFKVLIGTSVRPYHGAVLREPQKPLE